MLHWRGESETARGIRLGDFTRVSKSVDDVIDLMGSFTRYGRNMEIFGEEEPADYLYKVVSGAVGIAKLMTDGRRQINAFYLPGDMFGLEMEAVHRYSAESIGDSEILIVRRSAFLAQARRDSEMLA